MSDDISQLIGRLRSYARSSKGDIFAAVDTIEALRAERDRLKVVLVRTAASLAAAISLLESVVKESLTTAADGKATKMAAPSDKMFRQMLADYNHALDGARKALEAKE